MEQLGSEPEQKQILDSTLEVIWDYFTDDLDVSDTQAAAIMGNMLVERAFYLLMHRTVIIRVKTIRSILMSMITMMVSNSKG